MTHMMKNRCMARVALGALLVGGTLTFAADPQKVGNVDISRWHGFNLLEKYTLRSNGLFKEDDFKWIAELGFNFVRLPMDYRCYTETNDWLKFKEPVLKEIDQAIEFGRQYNIHVCLNLHRAPGFCINPPAEATDLWKDQLAQDAFVAHWVMFAKRYQHIPQERLSFNLLNEPTRNTRESYLKVNSRVIEAIHAVDPKRIVVVDGNNVGKDAIPEFLQYSNVVQATRGYHPGSISHYKASWVKGSDKWPEPTWPPSKVVGQLYGPVKPEFKSPLVLKGDFKAGTEIALKLLQLSGKAKLQAKADGQVVGELLCDPKASPDAWKPVKSGSKYTYQEPTAELSFKVTLPSAAKEISVENVDGDWIKFSELSLRLPNGARHAYGTDLSWGAKQTTEEVSADGRLVTAPGANSSQTLVNYLKPWRDLSAQGGAVFVGEWGCHNKTPHPVMLAWMKAWLEEWQKARYGWAVWNFRGSFGLLDSGRSDVQYEDWHGHKLDREMLELLQAYQQQAGKR
jgi:aryl-phospho-beta-D-glucosidase BglC (GH1 family)